MTTEIFAGVLESDSTPGVSEGPTALLGVATNRNQYLLSQSVHGVYSGSDRWDVASDGLLGIDTSHWRRGSRLRMYGWRDRNHVEPSSTEDEV